MRRFRPYQVDAFNYAVEQDHPVEWMEMRLGKTLVAIRRIKQYGKDLRVLIVAPNSALGSWLDELRTEGETDVVWLRGSRSDRVGKLEENHKWYLVNKEAHLTIPELRFQPWDCVVLDESTFIKNPKAKVTQFFSYANWCHVPHRWILTGTPNPQGDLDLWCQLAFLDGSFMGCRSYWDFRAKYFHVPWGYDWVPLPGAAEKIAAALRSRCFILRRRDVNIGPEKIISTRAVSLDPVTARRYSDIERDFAVEIMGKESKTLWAGARYTWLRRLCGGFDVEGKQMVSSEKMAELMDLLTGELVHEQVVVWFNFNAEVKAAREYCKQNKVSMASITGEDSVEQREKMRTWFQTKGVRVLLVQQAVAQTGMNLSAADTAIYYAPPMGALAKSQTEDRILSVDKTSPLLYIRLVCPDTVDEDLWTNLSGQVMLNDLTLSRALKDCIMQRRSNV